MGGNDCNFGFACPLQLAAKRNGFRVVSSMQITTARRRRSQALMRRPPASPGLLLAMSMSSAVM